MRLHVEHEVIGGETVVEKFDGVESFNDPPMTESLHLSFFDGSSERLTAGEVVRAESEREHD